MKTKHLSYLVLLLVLTFLSGCKTVEAWEKSEFAHYTMRPDRDPIAQGLAEHTYVSREGALGGRGVGGGGCGCD